MDKTALLLFAASIALVAVIMELVKTYKTKAPWFWWVCSAVISSACTCFVWFGVEHTGNIALLPLFLISGWVGQYLLDMYGVKKALLHIATAYAKKHGWKLPEDLNCVDKD